jgi:MEMO1 family protein
VSANVQEIRVAAHAGILYPADGEFLAKVVDGYIQAAKPSSEEICPKAIITPHGGYVYSGRIAGMAFAPWKHMEVERVVVIGPSHIYDFDGIAVPDTSVFTTPLGELQIDKKSTDQLEKFSFVRRFEAAHHPELSIELQLPFIQRLFGSPLIVPLVTGKADSRVVTAALNAVWGEAETVIVVSSDLSRFHDFETAQRIDGNTSRLIQEFRHSLVTVDQACGFRAIRGLLQCAVKREMRCVPAGLGNSGAVGELNEVTGYGAFHFYQD